METNNIDRGSQPAYPQQVCPKCKGEGAFYVNEDPDGYLNTGRPHCKRLDCPRCHGTGLIGGGMTIREKCIEAALGRITVVSYNNVQPDMVAKLAISVADSIVAALNGGGK